MSDKPSLAEIRERARKYLPGMVGYSARLVGRMSVEDVSHGCVRNDPELLSDAVMNAGHIQFKDVPALLAAVDAVLAACARADERCDYATVTAFDRDLNISAPALLTSEVRDAITAHLDIEEQR